MTCNQTQTKQKEVIMSANVYNGIVSGYPNSGFNDLLEIWKNSCESWHMLLRGQRKTEDKLLYVFDTEKEPEELRPYDELERYEDAPEIGNLIEEKLEEEKKRDKNLEEWELEPIPSQYERICIDGLLGTYEYDNATNKGKITLYGKPILKTANKLGIDSFYFSSFIEAHEYPHAKMCTSLNTPLDFYRNFGSGVQIHKNAAYLYIEEGLANAYALKVFENSPYFPQLVNFVRHQASHYRFGLFLYNKYGNKEILAMWMRWWREFKSRESDYKKFLNKLL